MKMLRIVAHKPSELGLVESEWYHSSMKNLHSSNYENRPQLLNSWDRAPTERLQSAHWPKAFVWFPLHKELLKAYSSKTAIWTFPFKMRILRTKFKRIPNKSKGLLKHFQRTQLTISKTQLETVSRDSRSTNFSARLWQTDCSICQASWRFRWKAFPERLSLKTFPLSQ